MGAGRPEAASHATRSSEAMPGAIRIANLAIVLCTPTVGGTLFVAIRLAKATIGGIARAPWPLLVAAIAAQLVIGCVPSLTTVVWRLVRQENAVSTALPERRAPA